MNPKRLAAASVAVSLILVGIFSVARAHAYSATNSTASLPMPPSGTSTFNFNFGSSFQNLLTPFQAFFNNLSNSIGNQPVVGSGATNNSPTLPTFNLQNITLQNGPHEIDQWFSTITQGSIGGFLKAILDIILWALQLAQALVQWLIGLIH